MKCSPSWRITVSLIWYFLSTPTEIWSEFCRTIQGDVTIVLDIHLPNPPVSDMHYAGIDLIKVTARYSNTPYPDTCVWITDAYNRRNS